MSNQVDGYKTFGYDVLNQLENLALPAQGLSESYSYDKARNRLSKATALTDASGTIVASYAYDA